MFFGEGRWLVFAIGLRQILLVRKRWSTPPKLSFGLPADELGAGLEYEYLPQSPSQVSLCGDVYYFYG